MGPRWLIYPILSYPMMTRLNAILALAKIHVQTQTAKPCKFCLYTAFMSNLQHVQWYLPFKNLNNNTAPSSSFSPS